jgi:CPA2 family monovalent cation:H+ antiporter-2
MFEVGLHFKFQDLLAVRRVAVPGALIQSLVATTVVTMACHWTGLTWRQSFVMGFAFSVASTAVLARMLSDHHQLSTPDGKLAMGWLLVEDLFTVIVLVVLPMLTVKHGGTSGQASVMEQLGMALGKFAVLVGLVVVVGKRVAPWLLNALATTREMYHLAVLVVPLAMAWMAVEFFDVSLPFGSFLGGVVAGQSRDLKRVEETIQPIRDPFAALFFLSLGTLIDPEYVLSHPVRLLLSLFVILLIKPVTALALVCWMRQPLRTGLLVAIGLAQVGEFSFILIRLGHELELLPKEAGHQLVAAAMISIMLNPFLFKNLSRIECCVRKVPWLKSVA